MCIQYSRRGGGGGCIQYSRRGGGGVYSLSKLAGGAVFSSMYIPVCMYTMPKTSGISKIQQTKNYYKLTIPIYCG